VERRDDGGGGPRQDPRSGDLRLAWTFGLGLGRSPGAGAPALIHVVSFDIDGTLEVGDPPGIVEVALVRRVQARGHLIGSASDRPVGFQQALWRGLGLAPAFTVLKHRLAEVRTRHAAAGYHHVGDTDVDELLARQAGFEFWRAEPAAHRAWIARLLGPP
jgi:hypothetical protein